MKRGRIITFDISKVDSNFEIESRIDKKDIKFYKIDEDPFKLYGVFKEKGDENVYFIDGFTLLENSDLTVDGTHPTDWGFYHMAKTIYPVLEKVLKNTTF